jgi:hypothetical protein
MMSPLRSVFIAVACFGIALSIASNNRLCVLEGRLLSDQDYFKGAIDVVIHDPLDGVVENVPGAVIFKQVHSQRYSSPDDFLSENPNCCRFVPPNSGDGGPEISLLDRIRGVQTVEVSYDKQYLDNNVQKTSTVSGKVAVTSCGTGRPFR